MTTSQIDAAARRQQAIEQLEAAQLVADPAVVVTSLGYGLNLLRDTLYDRMHRDVEDRFGVDSMLMPVSLDATEEHAKIEIDCFQAVEVARRAADLCKATAPVEWFTAWLARWRLGTAPVDAPIYRRLDKYAATEASQRQHRFSVVLERALPEATKAPLILYRLFPLAVQVVATTSFDSTSSAERFRQQQQTLLPAIADCKACRGRVLENGESCSACGNPLWKFDVLMESD